MNEGKYDDLLAHFTREEVVETYVSFWRDVPDFLRARGDSFVELNQFKLEVTVVSYLADVMRMELFHPIKTVNSCKRAGYKAFWWLENAPLQVGNSSADRKSVYINESFAAWYIVITGVLRNSPVKFRDLNAEDIKAVNQFARRLIHYFRFQPVSAPAIEMLLEGFRMGQAISFGKTKTKWNF